MDILSILSKYGILKSYINLGFGIILFILFLLVGVKLVMKNPYPNKTLGEIVKVNTKNCDKCTASISYSIADKKYIGITVLDGANYKKGDQVTVYYDSDKNSTIANPNIISRGGFVIVCCGLIILGLFNLNYVFARKSKTYSTTLGAINVINDISLLSPSLI
jgi:hypothetical protein